MADLTVQTLNANIGNVVTFAAAAGGGDAVPDFQSNIEIRVKNGGGSPITVTFASHELCNQGIDHDLAESVSNGAEESFKFSPASRWRNPTTGKLDITYSGVTTVTVAAVKHP